MKFEGLFKRCFAESERKSTIISSHLPYENGYYVTEHDVVLKVEKPLIYRLTENGWKNEQSFFDLWYDSMTDFADISPSTAAELGIEKDMKKTDNLREELFEVLRAKGARLMGVADLEGIVDGDMKIGISVAVPVPVHIVENLKTAPTMEYYYMYQALNARLDEIVTAGADFLISKGYKAQANTTKIVKSDENWATPLPHKTVATRAGLGWIGKNCLLITKEFGGAQRISSLITDAPLTPDEPINESRCGECTVCVDRCPGKALHNTLWTAGMKREEIFNKEICKKAQEVQMEKATGLKTDLCGMCYAVCPYTQNYLKMER